MKDIIIIMKSNHAKVFGWLLCGLHPTLCPQLDGVRARWDELWMYKHTQTHLTNDERTNTHACRDKHPAKRQKKHERDSDKVWEPNLKDILLLFLSWMNTQTQKCYWHSGALSWRPSACCRTDAASHRWLCLHLYSRERASPLDSELYTQIHTYTHTYMRRNMCSIFKTRKMAVTSVMTQKYLTTVWLGGNKISSDSSFIKNPTK